MSNIADDTRPPPAQQAQNSTPSNPPTSASLQANVEFMLKFATAFVAMLYIFGLVISNVQLMEIGIADFTSLQARNITVGFLFLVYLLFWSIPFLLITWFIFEWGRFQKHTDVTRRQKLLWWSVQLVSFILAVVVAIPMIGLAFGALYYRPLDSAPLFGGGLMDVLATGLNYFGKVYVRPETIFTAALSLNLLIQFPLMISLSNPAFVRKLGARLGSFSNLPTDADDAALRLKLRRRMTITAVPIAVMLLIPSLYGYSREVYPNLRYNLGGGQPQISDITLSGKRSELAAFAAAKLGEQICCAAQSSPPGGAERGAEPDQAIRIPQVAIWYQSDKFLYLTKTDAPASRVIAIDLKLVRSIANLQKFAVVGSGARVVSLHDY